MHNIFQIRSPRSRYGSRKSTIQNQKLVGVSVIAFMFMLAGAVAEAQQPTKIRRIGFLDRRTASGSVLYLDVFRQELSKLGWV